MYYMWLYYQTLFYIHCIPIQVHVPGSSMVVVGEISSGKCSTASEVSEVSFVDPCRTEIQNAQFFLKYNNLRDAKQG